MEAGRPGGAVRVSVQVCKATARAEVDLRHPESAQGDLRQPLRRICDLFGVTIATAQHYASVLGHPGLAGAGTNPAPSGLVPGQENQATRKP